MRVFLVLCALYVVFKVADEPVKPVECPTQPQVDPGEQHLANLVTLYNYVEARNDH